MLHRASSTAMHQCIASDASATLMLAVHAVGIVDTDSMYCVQHCMTVATCSCMTCTSFCHDAASILTEGSACHATASSYCQDQVLQEVYGSYAAIDLRLCHLRPELRGPVDRPYPQDHVTQASNGRPWHIELADRLAV